MKNPILMTPAALLLGAAGAADIPQDHPEDAPNRVIVTASPLRESILEMAQPMDILDADRLRRAISSSIGETVESMPGISATWFGPAASRPVIRGQTGERVQVLEDGIGSLDASSLSPDHAVTIESVLARQVEILKGPATLLYGNGAVGGLVNVVTGRVPTEMPVGLEGAFELRGNTAIEERAGAAWLEAAAGPFAFHVDAYKRETGNVEIPGTAWSRAVREEHAAEGEEVDLTSGEVHNSMSASEGGAVGMSYIGGRGYLGVSASILDSAYGIPGPEEHHEEEGEPTAARVHSYRPRSVSIDPEGVSIDLKQRRYDVRGQVEFQDSPVTVARLAATFNDYEHQELEPDGGVGTSFEQDALETRMSFDHAPLGGWRGTFGLHYRNIDLTAEGAEAFVPPSLTRNTGLFLFEERHGERLTFESGVRFERQEVADEGSSGLPSYEGTSVNLSGGIVWRFANEHLLSVNLTRTQRHPTATELFANGPHLAIRRFEIGDASLDRETAVTADISLRKHAGRLHYGVSVYQNDFEDYIFPFFTGAEADGLPVAQYVQQDARFRGAEAELDFPLFEGDWGRLDGRIAADYVRGKLQNGGNLPQVPPLRFGAELRFEQEGWQAGIAGWRHAEQDETAPNELPSRAYTLIDADVGYRAALAAGELHIFLKGSNLLDREARRHSSPLKEFVPLPGRSFGAGVRMSF